ncbi:hypothetical protein AB0D04_30895 [Streptomyces sp. NPDC048483]|uniref:hypothetical protein n=1 Tax=Streptomyces sp. NPDC048483 TaxID=3154927 RepID=UPI00342261DB
MRLVGQGESGDPSSEVIAHAALVSPTHQSPPEKGQQKVKYAKSAVIVVGSALAIGAAAPAFASGPTTPRMHRSGGLTETLAANHVDGRHIAPLVNTVKDTAKSVKGGPKLLHGNKFDNGSRGLLRGLLPLGK